MSAWVVSKVHIDLLVRAADAYGRERSQIQGSFFRWWKTDEQGAYAGMYELHPSAESTPHGNPDYCERLSYSQAGQLLVSENVRSVEGRYPDTDADRGDLPGPVDAYYMGPYVYKDPGYVLSPGEVFKAIGCLNYQSCEHDEWQTSSAYQFLQSLRECACTAVPGYDEAPWGFDSVPTSAA